MISASLPGFLVAVKHGTCKQWIASRYVLPLRRWVHSKLIGPSALRVSDKWLLEHDSAAGRRGDERVLCGARRSMRIRSIVRGPATPSARSPKSGMADESLSFPNPRPLASRRGEKTVARGENASSRNRGERNYV